MSSVETDEQLTVAGYLARALPGFGVSHVFELVGGMLTVMLDSLHRNPDLTVVSMHHEQGAGFAAEGFTRTSGRPSVAMATSGPGATNLLTAIGSCYFDSVPVVFITGQVNTTRNGKSQAVPQATVAITAPIGYNGATAVRGTASPVTNDDGCFGIQSGDTAPTAPCGTCITTSISWARFSMAVIYSSKLSHSHERPS